MKLLPIISFLNLTTLDLTCFREQYQNNYKNEKEATQPFAIVYKNAKQKGNELFKANKSI